MKRWKKMTGLSALALMIGVANVSFVIANDANTTSQPRELGNDSGMGQENHNDGTRAKTKAHKRYTKKKSDRAKHASSDNTGVNTTTPSNDTPSSESGAPSSTNLNGIRSTNNGKYGNPITN